MLLDPYARAAGLVGLTQFNLGVESDNRVPDGGYLRGVPSEVGVPTAAIVVEILSPHEETWLKFDFYARRAVDEICVADLSAGGSGGSLSPATPTPRSPAAPCRASRLRN